MKNLVLIFDRACHQPGQQTATHAETLFRLLDDSDEQATWYHPGMRMADRGSWPSRLRWRDTAVDDVRGSVAEAYEFLVDCWEPGDHIYLFGVGRGGYCAQTLARLLGTVGVLPDLMDYVLATYTVPRTARTPQDWNRLARLAADLSGSTEIGVPVRFLGLWDAVKVPWLPTCSVPDAMPNVVWGRHAVAIDGPHGEQLVAASRHIEEVWFRGAHCDIAGGAGACAPLADIALDWMLEGAIVWGLIVSPQRRHIAAAPSEVHALAGSAHPMAVRKLPDDAVLHASVDLYLRARPAYWKRLPARVEWADPDWAARSERLLQTEEAPVRVSPAVLVAAAS